MLHENLNDSFETFFRLEFSLLEDCLPFTNSFIWVEKPSARISMYTRQMGKGTEQRGQVTPNWENPAFKKGS